MSFLAEYQAHTLERAKENIPPLPLNVEQVKAVIEGLLHPSNEEIETFKELLSHRVSPGVDEAAKVKAEFLDKIAKGTLACEASHPKRQFHSLAPCLEATTSSPSSKR